MYGCKYKMQNSRIGSDISKHSKVITFSYIISRIIILIEHLTD